MKNAVIVCKKSFLFALRFSPFKNGILEKRRKRMAVPGSLVLIIIVSIIVIIVDGASRVLPKNSL